MLLPFAAKASLDFAAMWKKVGNFPSLLGFCQENTCFKLTPKRARPAT